MLSLLFKFLFPIPLINDNLVKLFIISFFHTTLIAFLNLGQMVKNDL